MILMEISYLLAKFTDDPRGTSWHSIEKALMHLLNIAEKAKIVTIIAERERWEAIKDLKVAFREMEEE